MIGAPLNACSCLYAWGQLLPLALPSGEQAEAAADELWREYHEEHRNELENFVEEQNDGKTSSADVFWEVGLCGKTMTCLHFSPLTLIGGGKRSSL